MTAIDALLKAMTLPEKLGQLTMIAAPYAVTGPTIVGDVTTGVGSGEIGNLLNIYGADRVHEAQRLAVEGSRLGIPLLIGLDVLHGYKTIFPVPLAEAGACDPELWEATARAAAIETASDGVNLVFAPMLDVARDPRWGRGVEGAGEDPWIASQFARAKVRGFQGGDLAAPTSVAACLKHYCAYGAAQAGRDYAYTDISERSLREIYLPPFVAGVSANAACVMPAFTDLSGVPMTAHRRLLTEELRGALKFSGVVISDYTAIAELIRHGVARDLVEAAALALNAGVDIDMMSYAYRDGLPEALERGLTTMAAVDAAVRRVLRLKEALGLFNNPYARGAVPETKEAVGARRQLARLAATRAAVFLKNDAEAPPLKPDMRRIAVIGPLADAATEMRGPWAGAASGEDHISVLAGLRAHAPQCEIIYEHGVGVNDAVDGDLILAAERAQTADVIVLCLGEDARMSGEAACRTNLDLPGLQHKLVDEICARAQARKIPVIALLFSGRPLIIPQLIDKCATVIAAWWLGSEAGHALADLLFGRARPSGRTMTTWPRATGQIPIFYGDRSSGRPNNPNDFFTSKYLDCPNSPLFAFGYGLTYGRLRLSRLRAAPTRARFDDRFIVEIDALNEGTSSTLETLFLFIRRRTARVTRPMLELKGAQLCELAAGERKTMRFELNAREFCYLDAQLSLIFDPGPVEICLGPWADLEDLVSIELELIG